MKPLSKELSNKDEEFQMIIKAKLYRLYLEREK